MFEPNMYLQKIINQNFNEKDREEIKKFPSIIELLAQWGQQDIYKHINNSWWSQFGESGLISYLDIIKNASKKTEFKFDSLLNLDSPFKLESAEFFYKAAVTFPDKLITCTKAEFIEKNKILIEVRCYSLKLKRIAFVAKYVLVSNNKEQPDFNSKLLSLIQRVEETAKSKNNQIRSNL